MILVKTEVAESGKIIAEWESVASERKSAFGYLGKTNLRDILMTNQPTPPSHSLNAEARSVLTMVSSLVGGISFTFTLDLEKANICSMA